MQKDQNDKKQPPLMMGCVANEIEDCINGSLLVDEKLRKAPAVGVFVLL